MLDFDCTFSVKLKFEIRFEFWFENIKLKLKNKKQKKEGFTCLRALSIPWPNSSSLYFDKWPARLAQLSQVRAWP